MERGFRSADSRTRGRNAPGREDYADRDRGARPRSRSPPRRTRNSSSEEKQRDRPRGGTRQDGRKAADFSRRGDSQGPFSSGRGSVSSNDDHNTKKANQSRIRNGGARDASYSRRPAVRSAGDRNVDREGRSNELSNIGPAGGDSKNSRNSHLPPSGASVHIPLKTKSKKDRKNKRPQSLSPARQQEDRARNDGRTEGSREDSHNPEERREPKQRKTLNKETGDRDTRQLSPVSVGEASELEEVTRKASKKARKGDKKDRGEKKAKREKKTPRNAPDHENASEGKPARKQARADEDGMDDSGKKPHRSAPSEYLRKSESSKEPATGTEEGRSSKERVADTNRGRNTSDSISNLTRNSPSKREERPRHHNNVRRTKEASRSSASDDDRDARNAKQQKQSSRGGERHRRAGYRDEEGPRAVSKTLAEQSEDNDDSENRKQNSSSKKVDVKLNPEAVRPLEEAGGDPPDKKKKSTSTTSTFGVAATPTKPPASSASATSSTTSASGPPERSRPPDGFLGPERKPSVDVDKREQRVNLAPVPRTIIRTKGDENVDTKAKNKSPDKSGITLKPRPGFDPDKRNKVDHNSSSNMKQGKPTGEPPSRGRAGSTSTTLEKQQGSQKGETVRNASTPDASAKVRPPQPSNPPPPSASGKKEGAGAASVQVVAAASSAAKTNKIEEQNVPSKDGGFTQAQGPKQNKMEIEIHSRPPSSTSVVTPSSSPQLTSRTTSGPADQMKTTTEAPVVVMARGSADAADRSSKTVSASQKEQAVIGPQLHSTVGAATKTGIPPPLSEKAGTAHRKGAPLSAQGACTGPWNIKVNSEQEDDDVDGVPLDVGEKTAARKKFETQPFGPLIHKPPGSLSSSHAAHHSSSSMRGFASQQANSGGSTSRTYNSFDNNKYNNNSGLAPSGSRTTSARFQPAAERPRAPGDYSSSNLPSPGIGPAASPTAVLPPPSASNQQQHDANATKRSIGALQAKSSAPPPASASQSIGATGKPTGAGGKEAKNSQPHMQPSTGAPAAATSNTAVPLNSSNYKGAQASSQQAAGRGKANTCGQQHGKGPAATVVNAAAGGGMAPAGFQSGNNVMSNTMAMQQAAVAGAMTAANMWPAQYAQVAMTPVNMMGVGQPGFSMMVVPSPNLIAAPAGAQTMPQQSPRPAQNVVGKGKDGASTTLPGGAPKSSAGAAPGGVTEADLREQHLPSDDDADMKEVEKDLRRGPRDRESSSSGGGHSSSSDEMNEENMLLAHGLTKEQVREKEKLKSKRRSRAELDLRQAPGRDRSDATSRHGEGNRNGDFHSFSKMNSTSGFNQQLQPGSQRTHVDLQMNIRAGGGGRGQHRGDSRHRRSRSPRGRRQRSSSRQCGRADAPQQRQSFVTGANNIGPMPLPDTKATTEALIDKRANELFQEKLRAMKNTRREDPIIYDSSDEDDEENHFSTWVGENMHPVDMLAHKVKYHKPQTVFQSDDFPGCLAALYQPKYTGENLEYYAQRLFEFLRRNIQWTTRKKHHQVAWYTQKDKKVPYGYDRNGAYDPIEFPKWMLAMRRHMLTVLNLPQDNPPHGCNINLYENGSASLGAHSDNEGIFDGIRSAIKIVSFSLGQQRTFQIVEWNKTWDESRQGMYNKVLKEKELPQLSFMTMEGNFQRDLKHQLPSEPDRTSPRINMTWRWILKPEAAGDAPEQSGKCARGGWKGGKNLNNRNRPDNQQGSFHNNYGQGKMNNMNMNNRAAAGGIAGTQQHHHKGYYNNFYRGNNNNFPYAVGAGTNTGGEAAGEADQVGGQNYDEQQSGEATSTAAGSGAKVKKTLQEVNNEYNRYADENMDVGEGGQDEQWNEEGQQDEEKAYGGNDLEEGAAEGQHWQEDEDSADDEEEEEEQEEGGGPASSSTQHVQISASGAASSYNNDFARPAMNIINRQNWQTQRTNNYTNAATFSCGKGRGKNNNRVAGGGGGHHFHNTTGA
ncbi:unnamed protein product [Amoebophrya sp. A25]|nr:unnamed protein product [Amoebophrya sp. A25]|eukprot:GSA25T00015690001.1